MRLHPHPGNRFCIVHPVHRFSGRQAKKDILTRNGTCGDFTCITTPAPANDQTWFKVYGTRDELMVVVAAFDTTAPDILRRDGRFLDHLELLFDPFHDHIGRIQFNFTEDGQCQLYHHIPYAAAHSTSFEWIEVRKSWWEHEADRTLHWLFVILGRKGVFRNGGACGFNVTRNHYVLREPVSWNHSSGNGFPDATGFGHLYRDTRPPSVSNLSASFQDGTLDLSGEFNGDRRSLSLELRDPLDQRVPLSLKAGRNGWRARVRLDPVIDGRYRLYPSTAAGPAEPEFWYFDLNVPRRKRPFSLGMTYDFPDNVIGSVYTPDRFRAEMRMLATWGTQRIYWLDYSDFPEFWKWNYWTREPALTVRHCGDVLRCAVELAHEQGMEFVGLLKPFDIGFNGPGLLRTDRGEVREIENSPLAVVPEMTAHQEWTMQSHPDWRCSPAFPVHKIALFSTQPIPRLDPKSLRIWESRDNRAYERYRKPFRIRQARLRRPHVRWTPAENIEEPGRRTNWFIEITGLHMEAPYVALEVKGGSTEMVNQAFVFAEGTDANGRRFFVTPSTSGSLSSGFHFWKEWPGWNNRTERILEHYRWTGSPMGIALGRVEHLPTLFEPSFGGVRESWLTRLRRILDSGADGIGIRTLCHHNACTEWLRYAFAEPVRRTFRERYGRDVQPQEEDYERVRRIRGEFYTEFLRQAKALASQYGKRLFVHFETGTEIPPHLDTRMQIHLDWERWLEDGLVDEIDLKFWAAQNPFIHERVLPAARRRGVPVNIVDRNSFLHSPRGVELVERLIREAYDAGFSGYAFYEVADYVRINREGVPAAVGHAEAALTKARDTLTDLVRSP